MINNKKMVFENDKYRLTEEYVLNELGLNLQEIAYDEFDSNPATLPERILKRTSNMVYEYLKTNCKDYYFACELIREDAEINDSFVDALSYQLENFIVKGDSALNGGEKIGARTLDILTGTGLLFKRRKPSFKVSGRYGE
jgi:hypothetical protein